MCWRALSSGADPARMLQARHECAQFALCWHAWTPASAPNSHKHPPEAGVCIAPAALSPVLRAGRPSGLEISVPRLLALQRAAAALGSLPRCRDEKSRG